MKLKRNPSNWHGLLFSTEMVLANLALRKTETRRISGEELKAINANLSYTWTVTPEVITTYNPKTKTDKIQHGYRFTCPGINDIVLISPYGEIGDVVYGRERLYKTVSESGWHYYADKRPVLTSIEDSEQYSDWIASKDKKAKHCTSIHMPTFAARIWGQITSLRLERLHDITEAGAIAEGIESVPSKLQKGVMLWKNYYSDEAEGYYTAIASYKSLWESINGPDSWTKNEYVWVIGYKAIDKPNPT